MAATREPSAGRFNNPLFDDTREAPRSPLRSVLAVGAGMIAIIALSVGADAVMHASGIFHLPGEPMSNGQLLLALAYRTVFAIAGGYLTARLAPGRRLGHALVLGGIGVLLSTLGAVATWNGGPEFEHKWYPIALIVTAIPCTWAGGMLYERGRVSTT
jgi:hypothetical protein